MSRSVLIICKPTYSLVKMWARSSKESPSDVDLEERAALKSSTLPGLTAGEIAESIVINSSVTSGSRPIDYRNPFRANVSVDQALQIRLYLTGASHDIETLFQDGVLTNVASSYYRAMTAQLMHVALAEQNQSNVVGHALINDNRVVMAELPLRLMESFLAVGILLVISMTLRVSSKCLAPWNLNHISSIATVVAKSEALRQSLVGTGSAPQDVLSMCLAGRYYFTQYSPSAGFSIAVTDSRSSEDADMNDHRDKYLAWKPFPNLICRLIMFVLVGLVIAALEVLLHFSQANDGLGNVSSSSEYVQYLWTFIPAAIMVIISMGFMGIDFNVRCLAPYVRLKQPKGATYEQSMTAGFLDSLPATNIFRSIRLGQFAVLCTTLTALIAPFLTIITSGLFSAVVVPQHIRTNLTQRGGFPDPQSIPDTEGSETDENSGIVIAEYILKYNLSYPSWTYGSLVFPELSIDLPSRQQQHMKDAFVELRVPTLRPAPICHLQTGSNLSFNLNQTVLNLEDGPANYYTLLVDLIRLGCDPDGPHTSWPIEVLSGETINSQPFGISFAFDCWMGNHSVTPTRSTASYIWGYIDNITATGGTSGIQHIAALTCLELAETVDAVTRFRLPSLEIDPTSYPPTPDESSTHRALTVHVPAPRWRILSKDTSTPFLDSFFQLLVSGRYAIPIEHIQSTNKTDRVADAIKSQHRIIHAQEFNNYTRRIAQNSTATSTPSLLPGTITATHRTRVKQDAASTRVLEALLVGMLGLGVVGSVVLKNTDQVLAKNPCSVGAVGSLVVDSNFLDRSDEDWRTGGWRFFLGWWEDGPLVLAEGDAGRDKFTL
ncbi:hypothetical protein BDV41DRAFT_552933 [Aspergillus transmontanensis]|uniref:Uncharacterized protein n=1 Tax=Aspergillus transmontanensis TaxID=1034304 RepID=A0A5N6VI62_9EURO|nr:hypothetical protein BDV41DRAFT_552933 [Aspergillus transmontanensis]